MLMLYGENGGVGFTFLAKVKPCVSCFIILYYYWFSWDWSGAEDLS